MKLRRAAVLIFGILLLGAVGGALWIRLGIYNIAATQQHTAPVFWLLQQGKKWSVRQRANEIAAPDLSDAGMRERGFRLYQDHCIQCHGAPGVARHDLGRGMTPVPTNLVAAARERTPEEIFWVVKHGIKMTGMPGWHYRLSDDEIWDLVAAVMQLPFFAPAEYRRQIAGLGARPPRPANDDRRGREQRQDASEGDAERGKVAIRQYACIVCHTVPGIVGPDTRVGPPLRGIGSRKYIAGVIPNTTANMIRWLQDPPAVDPLTAMPDLDVTLSHARDMAAYLATLEQPEGTPTGIVTDTMAAGDGQR